MSTVWMRCPHCGTGLRVAVQPSFVEKLKGRLKVSFDSQTVAHVCAEPEVKDEP